MGWRLDQRDSGEYLERMQERWVGLCTRGKVVRKARLQPMRMV
jgi:hypothetical protein